MFLVFFIALIALQSATASSNEFLWEKPLIFNSRSLENSTSVNNTSVNSTSVNNTSINSTSANNTLLNSTSTNGTNNTNTTTHLPGNPLRFILYYATLYGQWSNAETVKQGTLFLEDAGYAVVQISSDETDSETDVTDTDTDFTDSTDTDTDASDTVSDSDVPDYTDDDFRLTIYDGMATNKNSIILNMNFENITYNETNSSFIGAQEISYVFSGNPNKTISGCLANISIFFINISTNTPLISRPHVELFNTGVQLQISSPQCSISLTTTVMTVTSFADTALPLYIGLMSLAGLIGAYSAYQMLKNFPDNAEELKSMSVWSLWITSAWELFMAIFHIYVAIKYYRFWILIVSFIFFFTISMLRKINQLILIVSRVERGDNLPLNSRMAMALVPMCILCVTYCFGAFDPSVAFLLLPGAVYMVPQIYRIWKKGERPSGYYWHNFAYAFSKAFFVGYYLLYSGNLFGNYPNLGIGYTFVGLIIAQILIVIAQRHMPQLVFTFRKFIHKQKTTGLTSDRNEECSICYELLVQESVINGEDYDQIVETPCHHRFHRRCIEEWLNLRGTCPLDRKKIDLGDLMF